jgi:hypothetical protein
VLGPFVPNTLGWCHGDSWRHGRYCIGTVPGLYHERPPYFSYFPPVYYGPYLANSCGISLCSQPSPICRRLSPPVVPLRIANPFVADGTTASLAHDPRAVEPLRIKNPHVGS